MNTFKAKRGGLHLEMVTWLESLELNLPSIDSRTTGLDREIHF